MSDKPWTDLRWQHRKHSRYKCRCNRRDCQARVTRAKHPDEYKVRKYARCPHYPNCPGHLYVDWFRMWTANMPKDRGEPCHCGGPRHMSPIHKKGDGDCVYREDVVMERAMRPRPKHHPYPVDEGVPF